MSAGDAVAAILKTKLYPPRLPAIVARDGLLRALDATRTARLTTMVAGAGYGKSTLAAAFLAAQKAPSVWYQLEETDQDLSAFIAYLVAGIGKEYGGFGERTLRSLQFAENVTKESRAILSTLISEMEEQIKEEYFIVLDDFHHVNDSSPITEALECILEHLPPNIHFIVLSRSRPNLDLSELAARRELVEITEEDLCFSHDEAGMLFADVFNRPLSSEHLEALSQLTEGWVSGLVLFHLAFKGKGEDEMEEAMRGFEDAPARLSEYLSRVVYANQTDTVKEFLVKTSVLTRMNPAFCDEMLGIDDSGSILTYLTHERLFTIPLDGRGEWYRYHHLLRTFLLETLSERLSPEEKGELNRRAATLWEKRGEVEQALQHYVEAGDHDRAAGILEVITPGLFTEQRLTVADRHMNLLPEETLNEHPMLVFFLARISDFAGDYEKAIEGYRRAALLFEEAGEVERQALALLNIARLMTTLGGRAEESWELMEKVREMASAGSPNWCEASAFVSLMAMQGGSPELAHQFWAEAMAHADEVADEAVRARTLYFCAWMPYLRGDHTQTCEIMTKACRLCEIIDEKFGLAYYYQFLSMALCKLGRFAEALQYAEKGLAACANLAQETVFTLLNRSAKAYALVFMGDREAALKEVAGACFSPGEYGAGSLTLFLESTVAEVYMLCGDRSNAREHYAAAERIAGEMKYPGVEMLAGLIMTWLSREELGLEAAREEVKATAESLRSTGAGLLTVPAQLLLALLELASGRKKEASEALEEVSAAEGGLIAWKGFWLGMVNGEEPAETLLPLVGEMFARGEHLDYWSCAFEVMGADSLPYLQGPEKSGDPGVGEKARELAEAISREAARPLRISMLGPFEVMRGEERIAEGEWKSKKALAVLKHMAANREKRLVPREVLMELLWPDSDPERSSKNLNMALTSLRKTLEPAAPRGKSAYIISSGESLYLEVGGGGWVDAELYRNKISEAKEAKAAGNHDLCLEALHEAEGLYRGDFLEEDLYEDWCRSERDRLKEEYLELLQDISNEYLGRCKHSEALRYVEKAIAADPGREGLSRNLMEICSKMGDRAGVERAFKRCSEYLRENFDVSPSRETEELYHSLRRE